MKVKAYIALVSEMCINIQFKNTLKLYQFRYTDKILVVLPLDWD